MSPKSDNSDGKPTDNSAWKYASEGMQLAVTLLLGIYVGYRLDLAKGTLPWFTLAGSVLGIAVGLYNFLKRFLNK